ncbi:D-glycero-beta-D-manno-heptose 1-phosphate adenylyltransferase [Tomitella cavernea]|uniref:D-glycero-beta-D-manno-heptose 1-phosphate adenylyltransferase n=1 Tax=Tomitella cavernea TaxID=1387982 RepID=A0ABP9CLI4_9ACTN
MDNAEVTRQHLAAAWTTPDPPSRPVVATGAFDILHVGHLRLLGEAHRRGRPLVVGVEDDERIRAWKGMTRPINSAVDRAAMLAALRCVDGAFIISGDPDVAGWREYCRVLEPIEPHALVFTVGDPHAEPKRLAAGALGAEVWEVPHVPKRSTTRIAGRLAGH